MARAVLGEHRRVGPATSPPGEEEEGQAMFNAVRAATVRARAGAGPAGGTRGGRPGPPASAGGRWGRLGAGGEGLGPRAISTSAKTGRPLPGALGPGAGRRGGETGGLTDVPPAACGLQGTTAAQDAFADPTRVSYTGGKGLISEGPGTRAAPGCGPNSRTTDLPPPGAPRPTPSRGAAAPLLRPRSAPLPGGGAARKRGEGGVDLPPRKQEEAGGGGSPQPAGTHCLHTACTLPAEALDPGGGGLAAPARCPEG